MIFYLQPKAGRNYLEISHKTYKVLLIIIIYNASYRQLPSASHQLIFSRIFELGSRQ